MNFWSTAFSSLILTVSNLYLSVSSSLFEDRFILLMMQINFFQQISTLIHNFLIQVQLKNG